MSVIPFVAPEPGEAGEAAAAQPETPAAVAAPGAAPAAAAPAPAAGPVASGPTSASATPQPPPKPAYPPPASSPTQAGPMGIRYDFNQGARILLPKRADGEPAWKVRLSDRDSGNVLFESENRGAVVASSKRFYVRFRVEVWAGEELVLEHDHDCKDRDVLIQFPVGTLGDILAWFPYAEKFRQAHGCRLTCTLSKLIIPLLRDAYPEITFVTHEEMVEQKLQDRFYATYSMGLFFDDKDCNWQPCDFRQVGLHRTAGYILGVDPTEVAPRITIEDDTRPIPEPYVCIAVQSSSGCKMWNNPLGWREVVQHLKASGYRVICIDQKPVHGSGLLYTHIPHGAEDQTGDRPLSERARWLKHADAFVGLSSGLAWLAWAAGARVVMISGFTHPINEFTTPFRVINWHACNSCWNDPKERFAHTDFMWCPRHQNTPRQFECTRLITGAHVKAALDRALAEARTPATKTRTTA
ncbi:MAG TPA: autotransporter strand-loop-strand O-heptosyltransferase [Caulobacteraceae bacterium]|nr:autotransporter strand-loop-strand O-heptosyltransferase [Caulobacteraceae bacterium]